MLNRLRPLAHAATRKGLAELRAELHEAQEIVRKSVMFDPNDGKKRVVITIGADGQFEPVAWYGVAHGLAEASNIAAHGALILTECVWRASVKAAANGE